MHVHSRTPLLSTYYRLNIIMFLLPRSRGSHRSSIHTTPPHVVTSRSALSNVVANTGEHAWDGRRHRSRLSGGQPGPAKPRPQLNQGAGQVGFGAGVDNLRGRR